MVGFPSPVVQGTVALTHALHPLALVLQLHRRPRGSPVLALPVRPPGKHLTLVLAPVLALGNPPQHQHATLHVIPEQSELAFNKSTSIVQPPDGTLIVYTMGMITR